MSEYDFVSEAEQPHVGGNVWQGDPLTYAPTVWGYMLDRFAARTVLDVGSGRGHAAAWMHKAGAQVVALDASMANVKSALYPTVWADLTMGAMYCPVDLVHCQEVAEHIPEIHVDNFLATLANGNTIVMSHAEPGQNGYHHVNCQPAEYWIEKLHAKGFRYLDIDSARVREMAQKDGAFHLARSGLVFSAGMR